MTVHECLLCNAEEHMKPEELPMLFVAIFDFANMLGQPAPQFANCCRKHALKHIEGVTNFARLCAVIKDGPGKEARPENRDAMLSRTVRKHLAAVETELMNIYDAKEGDGLDE